MITKGIELAKEIRLFLAFIMSLGLTTSLNFELVMNYVYTYNIHIVAGNAVFFYVHHFFSNKRHKKTETELTKIQVRAEIRQAFKDYQEVEAINFESNIKYINDLNAKKIELGINSYTDGMMETLLKKIKV